MYTLDRESPLDLRQLEIIRAIAETGSFTAAGHKLHVSQSAISRQIRSLEDEIGATLFLRGTRHVELTSAGAALLRAHEAPWAAVGPQVGTDAKLGRHDLIELVSSGPWSVPAQRGEARILRWQNVAYKRAVLLRQGARLGDLFCAEGTFFQLLRAQGERLYVEPEARIIHSHEMHLAAFLLGNTYSSRLTAARRARLLALSPLQRLLRAANALLTPLRSLWQLRRRILAMPAGPEPTMATFLPGPAPQRFSGV